MRQFPSSCRSSFAPAGFVPSVSFPPVCFSRLSPVVVSAVGVSCLPVSAVVAVGRACGGFGSAQFRASQGCFVSASVSFSSVGSARAFARFARVACGGWVRSGSVVSWCSVRAFLSAY